MRFNAEATLLRAIARVVDDAVIVASGTAGDVVNELASEVISDYMDSTLWEAGQGMCVELKYRLRLRAYISGTQSMPNNYGRVIVFRLAVLRTLGSRLHL